MITPNDTRKCDFCGSENGEFNFDTGNHTACESLSATIAAQAERIKALEAALKPFDNAYRSWKKSDHPYRTYGAFAQMYMDVYEPLAWGQIAALLTPQPAPAPEPETPRLELNEYQQAHAAVITDGPGSQTAWAAFEATKARKLGSDATSRRDEREGKHG